MSDTSLTRRRLQITKSIQKASSKPEAPAPAQAVLIPRTPRSELLPLSFAQQRLWFLEQLAPGSPLYTIPVAWRLSGQLQVQSLQRSLSILIQRHEILRSTIVVQDGEPLQHIHAHMPFTLERIAVQDADPAAQERQVRQWLLQEAQRSFDLERGPLFHLLLLELSATEHILLLSMHHSIADGWSIGVLLRELSSLYSADVRKQPATLPVLPIQYVDFAVWQKQWLQGAQLQQQLAYWKNHLQGAATLELPTDYPRPLKMSYQGSTVEITVPVILSNGLKQLSMKNGTTLYMTLLTIFKVLLARYSGQSDIVVGTPVASRTQMELEGLIGLLANTVVLRTDLAGDIAFIEALRRVRTTALEAYAHQDTPFEKVVEALQPERDPGRSPLFQVMFMLQNTPTGHSTMADLQIEPMRYEVVATKYDLTFSITDTPAGLLCTMEYNRALFMEQTMQRMLENWLQLAGQFVENALQSIQRARLLGTAEYQYLIETCNATAQIDPEPQLFLERLAEQARLNPTAVAVYSGADTLSYAELERRSNQLAHFLRRCGIGPDKVVGLCLPRGLDTLIAMLGIFKAGGAYLPLDPSYPQQRLEYMLTNAGAKFVLTHQDLLSTLPAGNVEYLCLDQIARQLVYEEVQAPHSELSPDHLAYIIYTSGTTGKPKGVMVTHGGLINYLSWAVAFYGVEHGMGSVVHSSLAFDLTVTSLFTPLLVGRSVVMVEEANGVESLVRAMRTYGRLSLLKLTPAHLHLLEASLKPEELAAIKATLVIGGESLERSRLEHWLSHATQARYINEYGPTETVVGCCVYEVSPQSEQPAQIPIGQPIKNTRLYVLDARLQPVPMGVIGELYIAGAGVARGYIQQPATTAERFLPDPFSTEAGMRMYRSGDRARYRADGVLEYFGRADNQVKVRGYRIEPGEIAACLEEHPMIAQALVLVREDQANEKMLVAYLQMAVDADQQQLQRQPLQQFLAQRLPTYMIPAHFVCLHAFPLTANGKIDRQALPAPERNEAAGTRKAPETPLEKALASIWEELLGIKDIGAEDNFFELGGHSLLGTRLIMRINRMFQVDFPLAAIFDVPVLADQALFIEDLILTEIEQMGETEV